MRIPALLMVSLLLPACSMFAPPDGRRPPHPDPYVLVRGADAEESRVERWTREQRQCENGDKDNQRSCIMGYPDD